MSETSLKNSLYNLDYDYYELYSEDYSMNQLWQFGNKSEEEINAEIEETFPTTQKRHVSPCGSDSQGCNHLLKIIAGITSGITDTISTSEYSVQFFQTMVTNV
jgi:hypothetical protein